MIARTFSATLLGVNAVEVEIECHHAEGNNFRITVVGLPDTAVKEARDRVIAAVTSSGFYMPFSGYVTFNLAPADLPKQGPAFDLPLALTAIAGREGIAAERLLECCVVGELALNGELRPVRGVLAIAQTARDKGRKQLILPKRVAAEASVVQGIEIIGVNDLREAVQYLKGEKGIEPEPCRAAEFFQAHANYGIDFSEVKGQQDAKRAIEVAVAGGHNLLMVGPPGTRPFRPPHHTISDAGLLGGGTNPGPGEVSLSHHGVLFLDELPEFRRSTLEVMRQPLEDGKVTISRAVGTVTFPAQFMLVAAMNPCPCGYYGDLKRECRCGPNVIQKYRQRISGPLLDRIDLHVDVPAVEYKTLTSQEHAETSEDIRARVEKARTIQRERFKSERGMHTNASMTPRLIRKHCELDAEGSGYLEHAMNGNNFSARAHDRILKVARTLADLHGSEKVEGDHLLEAINYRTLDRALWS
jgi:magnesium chelatase family protein